MEFSLIDLGKRFIKHSWIIVLAVILFAGAGFTYAKSAKISTNYSATRSVIVAKNNTDVKDPASRYSADKAMLTTYEKIAKDDAIVSSVQSRLNKKMTKSEIASAITITNPSDTVMLNFKATGETAEKAKQLSNVYAEAFAEIGPKLYGDMGQPTLLSEATGSDVATSGMKNTKKLTLFGAFVGFIVSIFSLLVSGIYSNYLKLKKQG